MPTSKRDRLYALIGKGIDAGSHGAVQALKPQDPLSDLLKMKQMESLDEERNDRRVERTSQAVDKSGIPQVAPALEKAEGSFQGKSVGPWMNALPGSVQGVANNIKSRIGEMFNYEPWKGAGEEFQDIQTLMNIDTRQFAGAAQTKFEQAKQEVEKGLQAGASPEQVRAGIQKMRAVLNERARNVVAGTSPKALQTYEDRGGINLRDLISGKSATAAGAPPSAPKPPSFEEWKAAKAAKKPIGGAQ